MEWITYFNIFLNASIFILFGLTLYFLYKGIKLDLDLLDSNKELCKTLDFLFEKFSTLKKRVEALEEFILNSNFKIIDVIELNIFYVKCQKEIKIKYKLGQGAEVFAMWDRDWNEKDLLKPGEKGYVEIYWPELE